MREKRKGKMNEFVQTDMKNKQTDSGAQAPVRARFEHKC